MNTSYIPNPLDEATRLEGTPANNQVTPAVADVPITKTATFAGTAFDLGVVASQAGIGKPLAAVIKYSGLVATGTYVATLMDSPDAATWTAIGPAITIPPGVASGKLSIPGFRTQRYVALALTLGGTSPSITYDAWLTQQGFPVTT
jgi:hypothetical protein